jgi:CubicO group peptidase (beta-lactamase class C family)
MKHCRPLLVIALGLLIAACGGGGSGGSLPAAPAAKYTYSIPPQTNDGWTTGHLEDHGFDLQRITEMINAINSGQFGGIDSITIVRDNTLLLHVTYPRSLDRFDAWVGNTDPGRHVLHSTSKSFTSALIGIAIDQGYIASVDVPFYDLFSYGSYQNDDPRKATMTLEDALNMRLGLEWDEWSLPYGTAGNDLEDLMKNNTDYAKALLDLPMESDPGTAFTYNTAATIAIGQALQNAVGTTMVSFANLYLFQPLEIQNAAWGRTPTNLANGGSGLFLAPRDMIKFGQLFVCGGVWKGQQIVSPEWVSASVEKHVALDFSLATGYGYQWWIGDFTHKSQPVESWSTRGYGGQDIFCVPSLDLVVAFTGQNYEANEFLPFSLMQDYILPSIDP